MTPSTSNLDLFGRPTMSYVSPGPLRNGRDVGCYPSSSLGAAVFVNPRAALPVTVDTWRCRTRPPSRIRQG
ncbi:MAG: hypothetical protein ACRDTK_16230, partial [Mycobacterium sp.]